MRPLSADYLTSAAKLSQLPADDVPEIALCGRSNVGKSSLLNALVGQRALARVSRTPGCTRLINLFTLEAMVRQGEAEVRTALRLADLPGFGFAKVAKSERRTWQPLIQGYLGERPNLRGVVLLMDARRVQMQRQDPGILAEEEDLMRWLLSLPLPVLPVMTKADLLAKHERKPTLQAAARLLGRTPVLCSAKDRLGIDDLWRRLPALIAERRGEAHVSGQP